MPIQCARVQTIPFGKEHGLSPRALDRIDGGAGSCIRPPPHNMAWHRSAVWRSSRLLTGSASGAGCQCSADMVSVASLMRHDLRKFGAGRESSFVYHRAKRAVMPLLIVPWILYLSLPFSLNPMAVFLPCAVMLGGTMAITAATFKKTPLISNQTPALKGRPQD